ncbi:isopenicillin N synthase family oxygenase [Leptolyngbya sp. NK1-12]|uniref:Isopenicillin N synthase family oxygenase n=1 Tax=Leptolyngbya sp. NK1-12 TaxID=2547451 RepID=A0AA97ANQ2_9CYAN|nr:isopenicillin N synthase family oxygenase [Leptolyngbya sp. NK1-12]
MSNLQTANSPISHIPVIDIRALLARTEERYRVAEQIGQACRDCGFFYIVGHGVDEELQRRLEQLSRQFFAQDLAEKLEICMARGGRAWRGYFPIGGELTSGQPDLKEGIYFGAELAESHPLVQAGVPMHGRNLFPTNLPRLRETVLGYMAAMTQLGHTLMAGIALSLGLPESYFAERYTWEPLILFRIFNYPPAVALSESEWGVGEHTDYGLLTILKQDHSGGLQIKVNQRWIEAPPIPNSFVCNLGDMLDRLTGGLYRSTPHRVRNLSGQHRLSFPFFFDPNFEAEIKPIKSVHPELLQADRNHRWDNASVHEFRGTYGDYILNKVSKVFPELKREVI